MYVIFVNKKLSKEKDETAAAAVVSSFSLLI